MVVICSQSYPETSEYDNHFQKYPFPLSDFQKYAIESIVKEQHVLVTAHTGSGKTLPAEFGIEYFHQQGKKLIYTSPIKALSNQKYYEFTKKFPHISFGLFTGDIKTNPEADVLIMTTEILMNYLFVSTQSTIDEPPLSGLPFQIDIQNELGCVVFDEVHYINDKDRGQTWEKTILMLPDHIQMIMLSATIDDPEGFAKWCEKDGSKEVWLASTHHRVVPLTHYGYMTTNEGVFKHIRDKETQKEIREHTNKLVLLKEPSGQFQDSGYKKLKYVQDQYSHNRLRINKTHALNELVRLLRDREMLPGIVFVFSRKQVESLAHDITVPIVTNDDDLPYNIRKECEQIIRRLPNFQEYLDLPEYNNLVSLLEKGIGIHHSGMIPVLREIVELMISKKYIYLLFATESFAIGLDCPIKTAVFSSMNKYDGHQERFLHAHEYTQMAGRAGRRGIDKVGHVVHCNNLFSLPSIHDYKLILGGKPQKLVSKYHISFSLLLNLMKNGQTNNFHEFSNKSMIHREIQRDLQAIQRDLDSFVKDIEKKKEGLSLLTTPYDTCVKILELEDTVKTAVNKKRKQVHQELSLLQDQHIKWKKDCDYVNKYITLNEEYQQCIQEQKHNMEYIETKTLCVLNMLEKQQFILYDPNLTVWRMTETGVVASQIAEVHGLVMSNLLQAWNYFEEFSVKQIIGFLSCFCDVNVPDDVRSVFPNSVDNFVNNRIEQCKDSHLEYFYLENHEGIYSGFDYQEALQYDMIDLALGWCDCQTEGQCKEFLQKNVVCEYQISAGDFNKALLKIVTITRELMVLCENQHQIECLSKLKKVEPFLLKYVTTSQSLYV